MSAVETDPRFAETFACVEATSLEHLTLWERWSTENTRRVPNENHRRLQWAQDNPGTLCAVGELAGKRVCVSVFWDIVGGRRVLFWEATSRVVDFEMVEAWIKERTPNTKERTNAMNFHNVAHAIAESL